MPFFDCIRKYTWLYFQTELRKGRDLYLYLSSTLPINLKLSSVIHANDLVDYICAYTYHAVLGINC